MSRARFRWSGCCALVLVLACLSAAHGEVRFEHSGDALTKYMEKIIIDTGTGRLEISRRLWSNTVAFTESGEALRLVDPFMYNAHGTRADGTRAGGYWNKPEVFDQWKVEEVEDAFRADATIVKISATQPDVGLRKDITIAVEKNENIAYVFSRITATEDLKHVSDRPTIYLINPEQAYMITVDGTQVVPEDGVSVPVNCYLLFQHKKSGASAAVVFLDRKVQSYPGSGSQPFGRVTFNVKEKTSGADCYWIKGGTMAKDAAYSQQYMIVWGDGDLTEKVEELSKKALAGELNKKVHPLP